MSVSAVPSTSSNCCSVSALLFLLMQELIFRIVHLTLQQPLPVPAPVAVPASVPMVPQMIVVKYPVGIEVKGCIVHWLVTSDDVMMTSDVMSDEKGFLI